MGCVVSVNNPGRVEVTRDQGEFGTGGGSLRRPAGYRGAGIWSHHDGVVVHDNCSALPRQGGPCRVAVPATRASRCRKDPFLPATSDSTAADPAAGGSRAPLRLMAVHAHPDDESSKG